MRPRRAVALLLIAGSAALTAFGASRAPVLRRLLEPLELTTLDWRVRSAPVHSAEGTPIVLVLFDSTSVGEWPYLVPFPRTVLAELIDIISAARPRVIALDVFLDRRYPALEVLGNGDARLRDAIQRAGNVILVSQTQDGGERRVLLPPDPFFASVAAGVGAADLPTPFETVRDAVLTARTQEGLIPGMSLATYAKARGLRLDSLLAAAQRTGHLPLPGIPTRYARLPADAAVQTLPIRFVGPPSRTDRDDGAFPAISSFAVLQLGAAFPAEMFRDKIVFLGTGFHAEDQFRSPFYEHTDSTGASYGWTYGSEVHATALENLLAGRYIVPVGAHVLLGLLFALALLVAIVTFLRGFGWGAATVVVLFAGVGWSAWYLFSTRTFHLPIVEPTLALASSLLGSTAYVSLVEGREKRAIRGAFSKYVAPEVVDQLVADPSRLKLGGEKRTVSILFSDLAGFTALSERTEPERLVALLNRYLDEMSRIVLQEGGMLDKYIGDAVMALYGTPAPQRDHAVRACRTALRMQARLAELNEDWRVEGFPALHLRVGINTGAPVVGNIGGEKRFDYTALGDAVNLAARLEPACKTYEVGILISEHTLQAAGNEVLARELDCVAVYGKQNPVHVFELIGLRGDGMDSRSEFLAHYSRGLEAYRRHDFALAEQYFRAASELDPADAPTGIYLERCLRYVASPPPDDWDFVERRQIK